MKYKLPFDIEDLDELEADDIKAFQKSTKYLLEDLDAIADNKFKYDLSGFQLFQSNPEIRCGFLLKKNKWIIFADVEYKYIGVKGRINEDEECQIWGIAELEKDFGHVIIRTEKILDKINEIFNPIELDFKEDKTFSKKNYVLFSEKEKAIIGLDSFFRNTINSIPLNDYYIEIVGNILIIGTKKVVNLKDTKIISDFIKKIF
ncbi:MAG: hypothetical protein ACOYMA_12115 [Bacteroidia bacterium]